MNNEAFRTGAAVVVANLCGAVCTAALAGADDQAGPQDADRVVLEEILVTATRRPLPLQDTPAGVSALSGAQLNAMGARDIYDYFAYMPGLNFTDNGWARQITIRGVASGVFIDPRPLSALYLDETPMMTVTGPAALGQIGSPHPEVFDLARIEVLRGPQGTLFGASAMGGAIRMITNPPNLERWQGRAEAEYSSTTHGGDNHLLGGVFNLPLLPGRLGLRINAFQREEDGFIDDPLRGIADVDSKKTVGGRIALLWQASDALRLTLNGLQQKRETGGLSLADADIGPYAQARYAGEYSNEDWELLSLGVDYAFRWGRLTSATSYVDRKPSNAEDVTLVTEAVFGVLNPSFNDYRDSVRDFVQELRLTSRADGRFSWLAGAYYQTEDRRYEQDFRSPGFDALTGGLAASFGYPDTLAHIVAPSSQRQRAVYGEVLFAITPRWRAIAGGRWFEFREQEDGVLDGVFFGGSVFINRSAEESGTTARFGVEFRPTADHLFFANAAEGFRPGGANAGFTDLIIDLCSADLAALGIDRPPPTFTSDSLWSYDLGARTTWLDRRLAATATIFYIDWKEMQTSKDLRCGITFVDNVGRATSEGLELETAWRPSKALSVSFGAAYVDARLAEAAPHVRGASGERIPTVPEWMLSASAEIEFELIGSTQVFARADYQYIDASWSNFDESIRAPIPSRQLVGLRTGLRGEWWRAEIYADNLLDERGVLYSSPYARGNVTEMLMRPRTIGLRTQVEFGPSR
jgi:outer membrane receptor protein involved in Fe transport